MSAIYFVVNFECPFAAASQNDAEILLQHYNPRPHTSFKTQGAIKNLGWTVLPHPPHSPDLAPSDFHLFGALEDALHLKRFGNVDEVIEEVASSTGFRLVHKGDRFCFFLLVQGCLKLLEIMQKNEVCGCLLSMFIIIINY